MWGGSAKIKSKPSSAYSFKKLQGVHHLHRGPQAGAAKVLPHAFRAARSASTKIAKAAPRLRASIPIAPEPAKGQALWPRHFFAQAGENCLPDAIHGGSDPGAGLWSGRPRASPAMTRMAQSTGFFCSFSSSDFGGALDRRMFISKPPTSWLTFAPISLSNRSVFGLSILPVTLKGISR